MLRVLVGQKFITDDCHNSLVWGILVGNWFLGIIRVSAPKFPNADLPE